MSSFGRKITGAAIALSLCAVPTAAIAATSTRAAPAAVPAAAPAPTNPWLTLSAMTTSSSAATSAAAAQGYDDEGPSFPPVIPLVIILATIAMAIYIVTKDDKDGDFSLVNPVSPD